MKWVEVIQLRSVENKHDRLESKLHRLIEEVNKEKKRRAIVAYNHALVDTDFSIHLFHDSKKVKMNGSRLGLRLASVLKTFGLVNHSVWIKMKDKKEIK